MPRGVGPWEGRDGEQAVSLPIHPFIYLSVYLPICACIYLCIYVSIHSRWLSRYRICRLCRRHKKRESDPWVRKIPWRRAWQATPAFLPEEYHGQRSLGATVHGGHKELGMTEWLTISLSSIHLSIHSCIHISSIHPGLGQDCSWSLNATLGL